MRLCPIRWRLPCFGRLPQGVSVITVGHERAHVCSEKCAKKYATRFKCILAGERMHFNERTHMRTIHFSIEEPTSSVEKENVAGTA